MSEKISQLGGDLNSQNIRCRRCHTQQTAGFDPRYGIMICANAVPTQGLLEDSLAHGMGYLCEWNLKLTLAQRWCTHTIIYDSKSTGRTT